VTRPGRRRQGLADLFEVDRLEAVLRVLREARRALDAGEIKAALEAGGVDRIALDLAWPHLQKKIKAHERVRVVDSRYAWSTKPREISAAEALDLLLRGRPAAKQKGELAEIVRGGLTGPASNGAGTDAAPPAAERAARDRQEAIDHVRALAELAIEVEELTANQASARAMIHRVRAEVKRIGLEPIDRAGDTTTFDPTRHESIGRPIAAGAAVVVVRPGYRWKSPSEDVLIAKAVVQDRS
jgi:hypothetical protein